MVSFISKQPEVIQHESMHHNLVPEVISRSIIPGGPSAEVRLEMSPMNLIIDSRFAWRSLRDAEIVLER